MAAVMPSQVVKTIDELFPAAQKNPTGVTLTIGHMPLLKGIRDLVSQVPQELLTVRPEDFAGLTIALSAIDNQLSHWTMRGDIGAMPQVRGQDAVTIIRNILIDCPDQFPPNASTDLTFISDPSLRDALRTDIGSIERSLQNSEWKAATVLAGSVIEALLLWRLDTPPVTDAQISTAIASCPAIFKKGALPIEREAWGLAQLLAVNAELGKVTSETQTAVTLAKDFRNLIHPGRSARLKQVCNRGTTYIAVGALERVIDDLK